MRLTSTSLVTIILVVFLAFGIFIKQRIDQKNRFRFVSHADGMGNRALTEEPTRVPGIYVTSRQFSAIQLGQSYRQVVDQFGGEEGIEINRSEGRYSGTIMITYAWKNNKGGVVNMKFESFPSRGPNLREYHLISKEQEGLE